MKCLAGFDSTFTEWWSLTVLSITWEYFLIKCFGEDTDLRLGVTWKCRKHKK